MKFSVIITTDISEIGIDKTINSLINQNINFEEFIEVIIIDNSIDNKIKPICDNFISKYPNNFKYIQDNNSTNIGLENANGTYVSFLDCGDTLKRDTLESISDFFAKHEEVDIVSIPIYFDNRPDKNHWSNKRFDKTKVVDLTKNPEYYQIFGSSTFIKANSIKDIKLLDVFRNQTVLVNEILINNPKLGLCSECACNSHIILEKNNSLYDVQSTKEYYINSCEKYFKHLIQLSLDKFGQVPLFIQNTIMYDIAVMLHAENTTDILEKHEVGKFKSEMREILGNIDDEVIFENNVMDDYLKINAFLLKYGEINDDTLSKFNLNTVFIDIYDIVNDNLYVMGNIPNVFPRDVEVFVNGKKNDINLLRFPQRDMAYFDYCYAKDYSFEFNIPILKDKNYEIEFKINNEVLDIDFSRPCNFSKVVGYAKTKNYLSILKDKKIIIEKKTAFKWIKQEMNAIIKMLKEKETGYKVGIPFRIAYMVGYPFLRNKHFWFFMDRPESADDNGMHMFKYAVDKDKNIKKYFILNKDSPDYSEMKKIGNVIPYKSIKHRYLGLFVENIVTTHPDNGIIYPFWGSYPHLAGLLKTNNNFLQHGIIKDDISSWLNKFNMNLSLFVTSSPLEYESVFKNPYNYNENIVKLTGLPRFDNLKNKEDKKQIIIMPSWRRYLTNKSHKFIMQTEYFQRFNSLINSEKLINAARKHNYEIIFRPHPNVYNFIELFDRNDYVKIDSPTTKYQTLFNNGSLLITDYSSVAFDFSYLHKPIIYYQYLDDYHFDVEDGYFKYETMGFGEVCKDEEELVNLIIDYIKNDCEMKEKYLKRVDDFFLYTDDNNCMRVYDAIKEIPLKD